MGFADGSDKFFKVGIIVLIILVGINSYQLIRSNVNNDSRFEKLNHSISRLRYEVTSGSDDSSVSELNEKLKDIESVIEGLKPKASRISLDALYDELVAIQTELEEMQNGPKLETNSWGLKVRTKKDVSLSKLNKSIDAIESAIIGDKIDSLDARIWRQTKKLDDIESEIKMMNQAKTSSLCGSNQKRSLPELYDKLEEVERLIKRGF